MHVIWVTEVVRRIYLPAYKIMHESIKLHPGRIDTCISRDKRNSIIDSEGPASHVQSESAEARTTHINRYMYRSLNR